MPDLAQYVQSQLDAAKVRVQLESGQQTVRATTVVASVAQLKQLIAANPLRIALLIGNVTGNTLVVGPANNIGTTAGLGIPNGNFAEWHFSRDGILCQQSWFCISQNGGTVYVVEVVLQPGG